MSNGLETHPAHATASGSTTIETDPAHTTASSCSHDVRNDFSQILESFTKLVEGDQDDGEAHMPSQITITVCELFNFENNNWVLPHKCSASCSLDEELELYELLDLDAPGDEDVHLEVDEVLDSILHV